MSPTIIIAAALAVVVVTLASPAERERMRNAYRVARQLKGGSV